MEIACTNCRQPFPAQGMPYRCPNCGGIFDFTSLPSFSPQAVEPDQPGLWRYRRSFGLPEGAPVVSLGEGMTPLIWSDVFNRPVGFKLEFLNPTGSFKDRGTAILMSCLKSRGIASAVEDSSGNAGASFAAYAARSGIHARVFVPGYASGPKRAQIAAYGAEVVPVPGPRSEAAEAVRRAAEEGAVYASHAYLPHGLVGLATAAYELVEQIGGPPGAVVTPAGQGSLLLGLARGFAALKAARVIERMPKLVGVQARACAPLWAVFEYGAAGLGWVTEGETLAEGVRTRHPLRGDTLLQVVQESGGFFAAVDEEAIVPGREALARLGYYVEPTSAIVWSGLEQSVDRLPDPIIVMLSGSGLKAAA